MLKAVTAVKNGSNWWLMEAEKNKEIITLG